MRSKLPLLLLLPLACLVLGLGATSDRPEPGNPGRFQIIAARSGGASPRDTVFRLDTATGKTWQFRSEAVRGHLIEAWFPVRELSELPEAQPEK